MNVCGLLLLSIIIIIILRDGVNYPGAQHKYLKINTVSGVCHRPSKY